MGISYIITCHNECNQLKKLIPHLEKYISENDEILILDDFSNDETLEYLKSTKHWSNTIQHKLNNDFSEHRNYGLAFCKKEYVFSIDADEIPCETLLLNLYDIIKENSDIDIFGVPRVNTIENLTEESVRNWGWRVSTLDGFDYPVINWHPTGDVQYRIHKNLPHIKWKDRLHEILTGGVMCELPIDTQFALIHHKTLARQEAQNLFYNKHFTQQENKGR